MNPKHLNTGDESRPIGVNWKTYWREREQADPERRREIRQEKRAARRRIHKNARRQIKDQLRNWRASSNSQ